ncbi:MAG: hypothetical protein K2M11_03330, partial [Paramuribaculum sp.]|nr:hypothetical protein [Paramuribaculum sp.]
PVEDDSLISFAAEYYAGRGDSLEAQSLFYLGYYNAEKRISDNALVLFSQAYETALAAHDIFYAAMSAREMSIVYRRLYMVDEGLKWARIAKQLFAEAGKPVHAAWTEHQIADALIYKGMYSDAAQLLDSTSISYYAESASFRHHIISNRIELALQLDSYKDVLNLYDRLSEDNYAFTAHDRLNQAFSAVRDGLLDDADSYLAMASELSMSGADSLYEGMVQSELYAARNNFKDAYRVSKTFGDELMSSDARLLTHPPTQLLTDNYKLKADIHRLQAARNRDYITGLIIVCLLLGVLLYIIWKYYKERLVNKMLEVEQLVSSSQILKEDLTLSHTNYNELTEENSILKNSIAGKENEIKHLITESRTLNDNLAESEKRYHEISEENIVLKNLISGKEAGFATELHAIFKNHLALFNKMCEIWHQHNQTEDGGEINNTIRYNRLCKEIGTALKKISDIKIIDGLTAVIDKYDDNWATRFKNLYPELNEQEYRLAIYIHLGFRPSTIAMISNRGNVHAVYLAKSRLKKKLVDMHKYDDRTLFDALFD